MMIRFLLTCLALAGLAGSGLAQGSKYTPVESGPSDPEAVKRLAAMLGAANPPAADPQLKELLEKWLKSTENNPAERDRLIEQARKQVEANPQQFQRDLQAKRPDLKPDELKQLMQGLGKPGELPQLPRPLERPPPTGPRPVPNNPGEPTPLPKPEANPPFLPPIKPANLPRPGLGNPNAEQVQGAVQMWEQTIGPIDSTPAVKDAIVDLFGHGSGGTDGKPFWDSPEFTGGDASAPKSGFWKFFDGAGGSSWTAPSWMKNFKAPTTSAPTPSKPSFDTPSVGGFGSIGLAGLGSFASILVGLLVALVVGFLIWKFLPMIRAGRVARPRPLPGQGPWPVDPRTIHDRAGLILAFEYLSVLVCGNGAVVWNHLTIAEALRTALPDREHLAEPLARLYAVARYTPMGEEISESAYAEARHCLCALAGVTEG